jgi:HEAT repeat protein
MISGRAPSELLVSPEHDKILNRMDNGQLELFAPRVRLDAASDAGNVQRLVAENISDEALIAALPDSTLADEAGRRRLIGAVSALTALCHRVVGFGVHDLVPEQSAALGALAEIGGREASRSVARMVGKGVIQGPTLAIAMAAASRLNVVFSPDVALPLLRHVSPLVRTSACDCVRAGREIATTLIDLLGDLDREVSTAAACALGRMGKGDARNQLKRHLKERPSHRVIEALAGVADEESIVFLARLGRDRPQLAGSVLAALDDIEHPRASTAASALRQRLSALSGDEGAQGAL